MADRPRVDFLGIGSQKAATTWLYKQLRAHPTTAFPSGKEVLYWNVKRLGGVSLKQYLAPFADAPKGRRQGEITPGYAILDATTIAAVHEALPKVRLFCTLRNPIARAWSAMEMIRAYAWLEPPETSDQFYIDLARSAESYRRGNFVYWLANWRAVFPRSRLWIIDYDDIVADPRRVMVELAQYLGLDPKFYAEQDEDLLRTKVNNGRKNQQTSQPRPAVLDALRELYAPLLPAMGEELGRDVSPWLEWDGART